MLCKYLMQSRCQLLFIFLLSVTNSFNFLLLQKNMRLTVFFVHSLFNQMCRIGHSVFSYRRLSLGSELQNMCCKRILGQHFSRCKSMPRHWFTSAENLVPGFLNFKNEKIAPLFKTTPPLQSLESNCPKPCSKTIITYSVLDCYARTL